MTSTEAPAQRYRHVFLDFDGPVCTVFGDVPATEVAQRLWSSLGVRGDVPAVAKSDPVALLRVVAEDERLDLVAAEQHLRELETAAVTTAPVTPGLHDALDAFARHGQTVTIVSNNSSQAVRAFLGTHSLDSYITAVASREQSDPSLLKPSPFLLQLAMEKLDATPPECVMVGDSTTDLQAAQAAEVDVIAYANKPGKAERFQPFAPRCIVDHMSSFAVEPGDGGHPARPSTMPSSVDVGDGYRGSQQRADRTR
jgi:HAD superfamily hydrolase (TIGR01662 family)